MRTQTTIGLILLAQMSAAPAWAAHRAHRPWLMLGHAHAHQAPVEKVVQPTALHPAPVVASRPATSPGDLEPKAVPAPGNEVADQALRYRGTRYRFGGTTKKGLDCSGLVSRVYEDLKLKQIPRASTALYKAGKPVNMADLRPGDLVFFKNTYRRGISHVGIYAGHNKFVHAANHKNGVTVTPLSDPYYQLHYAGARRLY